jgi:hypothetical protein
MGCANKAFDNIDEKKSISNGLVILPTCWATTSKCGVAFTNQPSRVKPSIIEHPWVSKHPNNSKEGSLANHTQLISKTKQWVLKTWMGFLNLPFMDVIFVFGNE